MCKKCKDNSCSGGCSTSTTGKELAALKNEVAELRDTLSTVYDATKALIGGHPMWYIENQEDVALFNMTTGLGSKKWEGWALCDGQTYISPITGNNVTTPNLLDKFVICTGPTYALDSTGGTATETLTVPQIPAHAHTLTDPGHTHDVTDPGHNHAATSAAHSHTITAAPHTHVLGDSGDHTHDVQVQNQGTGDRSGGGTSTAEDGATTYTTTAGGNHTHGVGSTTVAVTAANTTASVSVSNAFVGITETETEDTGITMSNTGGGLPHNNIPPYYSSIMIMKL